MKIKVCGLKLAENLQSLSKFKPDYLGFVCFDGSKRYVDLENWDKLAFNMKDIGIPKVMVCVNPTLDFIDSYLKIAKFDYIQLHGNEDVSFCKSVKNTFNIKIIKAFSVSENFNFKQCSDFKDFSEFFIFDTKSEKYGGSGKVFNWNVLKNYNLKTNYLLSGGLNLSNIKEAFKHVSNYKEAIGLDVNSGFELKPGVKDIDKLEVLFNQRDSNGF